ncbi:MAG: DUF3048 domain-containing protein [Bacillota bacterium]
MKRLVVAGCLLFLILALSGCGQKPVENPPAPDPPSGQPTQEQPTQEQPAEPGILNPLTGQRVQTTAKLIAVMIDNLPQARPQSGLSKADIVWEIEAEGLVTRLMALFYGDPPEIVGPVRSARPYYMALAKEWDAYYAHVGGSNDAASKIDEWKIRSINDLMGHPGYSVDQTRQRPHSTYLTLAKALENKSPNGIFPNWKFEAPKAGKPDFGAIKLDYDKQNKVTYTFSADKEAYLRQQNGSPMVDRVTGEQIFVRNVIIQYARHRNLNNELKHVEVEVIGEGKAEYFLGGRYLEGSWRKKDLTAPTEFLDAEGRPVAFAPGNTWIQVVRSPSQVKKNK